MTTITLAQPRKIFTATGDTVTGLALDSPPTQGNTLIALVYAHSSEGGMGNAQTTPPDGWTGIENESVYNIWIGALTKSILLADMVADSDFSFTVPGAERMVVHLYEVEAPPEGFAFSFLGAIGTAAWNDSGYSNGGLATLTYNGFPLITGDIDMGVILAAGFDTPLSNTTTEPTVSQDFGGNIGPATDGGRFASEFASVSITGPSHAWEFNWTGPTDEYAVVLGVGLIADRSSFTRRQKKASLTSSVTLNTAPVIGNLLVATLGVGAGEIPSNVTGWNRIVGTADDNGDRICFFWREVTANQSSTISFDADNAYGISVEEWTGFLGSPVVSGLVAGADLAAVISHSMSLGGIVGLYAAYVPPLPIIDRIALTGLLLPSRPDDGVMGFGDDLQTGITGQRVYSAADASAIVSSIYPGLVGTYWKSGTALDGQGLSIIFSDSSEVVVPETPEPTPDPTGPFVFPDEGSRLAYTAPTRRGGALTSAKGVEGYVYLDAEATTLAAITDLSGDSIPGSLITVDDDSKIPLFQGPGTATTLYVRWAGTDTTYPVYARSESAPVDYGSFDPEGFALLAGGNAFTGRQDLLTDLPTLTVEDLNGDAEWTVLSSVKDDLGQMRSAMLGAKVDLSPFNLGIQRVIGVATFEADKQTGLNTGRILGQIATTATDENGADLGMRILNGVLPDMRIIHMLSSDVTSALLTVGTPQLPSDAATKQYVDDAVAGVEAGTGVDAGVVNVKDHGAVLDGITDDWSAFDAAFTQAVAEGKRTVYVPANETLVSRPIIVPGGVRLRGAGIDRTTIKRPASVGSSMAGGYMPQGSTTVVVTDASVFAVGNPIHLWDSANFEGDDARRYITAIDLDTNTITFDVPTSFDYDESLGGKASTSFALVCGEGDSEHGAISDLTLDQAVSAFDPKGTTVGGNSVVDFTKATVHLEQCRHWTVERVRFINAIGDAYSDQGRASIAGSNHNELAWCIIESPYRHAIHLGTANDGSHVHHNVVKGASDGYCFFFCADVTRCTVEDNYFENSTSGLAGIDDRDNWNIIARNEFNNVARPIVAQGVPTDGFSLLVEGNIFYTDINVPTSISMSLNIPNVQFVNNRLHNMVLRLGVNAHDSLCSGNLFTMSTNLEDRVVGSEFSILAEGPDMTVSNNRFSYVYRGILIDSAHRLHAFGNTFSHIDINEYEIAYNPTVAARIDGDSPQIAYVDGGSGPGLLVNGVGSNGANDPNSPSGWYNPGASYSGTIVTQDLGEGTVVLWMYVHGTGWISIGTS